MPASPLRSLRLIAFSLAVLVAALPVGAEEQAPPVEPAPLTALTQSGLEVSADLRSSYLAGHDLVVTVSIKNVATELQSFPNLEERPYLVVFELVSPDGKKQTRRSTPPSEEDDIRWQLAPRATRRATLQIPSGGALAAGRYRLALTVHDGEESLPIGPVDALLEAPAPLGADLLQAAVGAQPLDWMTPWIHLSSEQGPQLYLHTVPAKDPAARGYHWHLAALEGASRPWLSSSRPSEGWSRYLYWRVDEHTLGHTRLEERRLRRAPRQVGLPWPSWELLARGGTDASAGLHVPVWIPAPTGDAGEVRVVSVDVRGTPTFRRVVKLPERPQASSWVDAAGQLRLLLLHQGKLDLYTVSNDSSAGVPASGRRLLPRSVGAKPSAPVGLNPQVADEAMLGLVGTILYDFIQERLDLFEPPPLLAARFASLPDREDQPGGTAVFALAGEAESRQAIISGVWLSTGGRIITTVPGTVLPEGHRVRDVLPQGYSPLVLVTEDARGVAWANCQAWKAPVELGSLDERAGLRQSSDGALWLVRVLEGRGVVNSRLEPEAQDG